MIAVAAVLGASPLSAQTQFTNIFGFGDSYADTGAAPGGAFRLANIPCIYQPNCTFTGSTTFVQSLQSIYGLPGMTNYAIGGARTDNTNTIGPLSPGFGFSYELAQSASRRYSSSDLIALSIGGNDLSAINLTLVADPHALIVSSASISAGNAAAGVQQMAAQGARNIAWLSTGSSKWFPEMPGSVALTNPLRDAWADTYYQQTQQLLAPLARSGVRIFLFNFGILQERVASNPGMYGFTSATNCEAGPAGPSTPVSVNVNFAGCFYQNSVHPTGTAMALIARYMANQIDAPLTVVSQGGITTGIAAGFAASVLGRLDANRGFQTFGLGPAMAMSYAMETKAPPSAPPQSRWSIYSDVAYGTGSFDRQFLASGYNYDTVGGTLGVEYRVDPRLRLGGVFGYAESTVNLDVQNAHDHIGSYQLAGYGSFTDTHWFADGLLAYGRHVYELDRQGVIDIVHADASADTFTAAGNAGYLVGIGPFRAGPIAGLSYTRAIIHAYTETGDNLITMMVDQQVVDSLTGDAGLQVRYPFLLGTALYSPFINLTAAHDFIGAGRTVTTTQVTAPLLPVLTPVPDNGQVYGKIYAGLAATIAGTLSATVSAATTFARDGGNAASVSGGIKVAF
jgi:uncharacterized protein YhjY with autotransporter beta-barrel domain/phospholipase/lecithinase/hemolysin